MRLPTSGPTVTAATATSPSATADAPAATAAGTTDTATHHALSLAHPSVMRPLPADLEDLANEYTLDNFTLSDGTLALMPGHFIRISGHNVRFEDVKIKGMGAAFMPLIQVMPGEQQ